MSDEQTLLAKAQSFDQDIISEIHHTYYEPLYSYVAYRIGDSDDVQDIVSEVFFRFIDALRSGRAPKTTLRGWLYGVANHVISEYWRKQKRSRSVELHEGLSSDDTGPIAKLEKKMDAVALRRAIETLTQDQQTVLTLRFAHEMTFKEIASVMQKSVGAVKQLQVRAISALSRHIAKGDIR